MNLETHIDNAAATIAINGEITLYNAPLLKKEIEGAKGQNNHVILDFSQVSYIDSSGIGVLVSARKLLTKDNGNLSLVKVPEPVHALLETCSLLKFFDVFSDHAQALSRFAQTKTA